MPWSMQRTISAPVAIVLPVPVCPGTIALCDGRAKAKPNSEALLTLLVVPFTDAAAFAVLAGLAYALRKNAAAHKRLIIIATAGLTRAALVRWHVPILFQHQHAAYTATYVFLVLLATSLLSKTDRNLATRVANGGFGCPELEI